MGRDDLFEEAGTTQGAEPPQPLTGENGVEKFPPL